MEGERLRKSLCDQDKSNGIHMMTVVEHDDGMREARFLV